MDRLSYGHSSLCQESRRLVLDGQMTVALTVRNADKAHGLSIQESHSKHFFKLTVGSLETYCASPQYWVLIKR